MAKDWLGGSDDPSRQRTLQKISSVDGQNIPPQLIILTLTL
jgi:hypothetical protein